VSSFLKAQQHMKGHSVLRSDTKLPAPKNNIFSAFTLLVGREEGHPAPKNVCFQTTWAGG